MPLEELYEKLKDIEFRGLYKKDGRIIKPYKKAKFSLATVYPPKSMGSYPTIKTKNKQEILFSPQPTVYLNQVDIIKTVDAFLSNKKMSIDKMDCAIEYDWQNRGVFHMLPPIIEKHTYDLKDGYIDLDKMLKLFKDFYVKDAKFNLHAITDRYFKNYFIDEVSAIKHLDIFNSNAGLINYGLKFNGKHDFHIVCDGVHRIDYAIEHLNKPITVILVEPKERSLVPYYAFPMPFFPTIRLSSKQSEKMYPRLERDKIHLLNDFIKKTLHYDWSPAGLSVSKLRSNADIN